MTAKEAKIILNKINLDPGLEDQFTEEEIKQLEHEAIKKA